MLFLLLFGGLAVNFASRWHSTLTMVVLTAANAHLRFPYPHVSVAEVSRLVVSLGLLLHVADAPLQLDAPVKGKPTRFVTVAAACFFLPPGCVSLSHLFVSNSWNFTFVLPQHTDFMDATHMRKALSFPFSSCFLLVCGRQMTNLISGTTAQSSTSPHSHVGCSMQK